jgi:hypothetical protein
VAAGEVTEDRQEVAADAERKDVPARPPSAAATISAGTIPSNTVRMRSALVVGSLPRTTSAYPDGSSARETGWTARGRGAGMRLGPGHPVEHPSGSAAISLDVPRARGWLLRREHQDDDKCDDEEEPEDAVEPSAAPLLLGERVAD